MSTKIATWNVNSITVRLPHLEAWLQSTQPDIVALQETKIPDDKFPMDKIEALGYQVLFNGQKTYNGVALLSRKPGQQVATTLPGADESQRRIIAATYQDLRVINVYVPNGASVDSEKYAYKLEWLSHLHLYLKAQLLQYPKLIVLGDFNIAPEDRDVHDPKAWEGQVLVSPKERAALRKILDLGFDDCFRLHQQGSEQYSWWDYRSGCYPKNQGLRIDLILTSSALRSSVIATDIDRKPRGWERPSDHTPVILTLKSE